MENFRKGPNVTEAAKVGEPTLVDPKQASAPDMVRGVTSSVMSSLNNLNGNNKVSVERVEPGAPPPGNALVPRSDAAPGAAACWSGNGVPAAGTAGNTAVPELQNDLQPAPSADASGAPEKAPPQVNDAAPASTPAAIRSPTAAASSSGTPAQAAAANPNTESTSKKKKKKLLGIF